MLLSPCEHAASALGATDKPTHLNFHVSSMMSIRSLVSYKGLTRPGEGVCCSHRTRSKVGIRFSFDMVRWGGLQQTASALVPN